MLLKPEAYDEKGSLYSAQEEWFSGKQQHALTEIMATLGGASSTELNQVIPSQTLMNCSFKDQTTLLPDNIHHVQAS